MTSARAEKRSHQPSPKIDLWNDLRACGEEVALDLWAKEDLGMTSARAEKRGRP